MKSFTVNDRVSHAQYGHGTIMEVGGEYTTIDFDQFGKKKFVTRIVQLEKSSEAGPPSRRRSKRRSKTI